MRYLTIHCAATTEEMDIGVAEIREWHLERGFRDVGYHYVIRRDGTLESGRPESQMGAHVGGHNTGNLGICMAGGVRPDGKTPADNFTAAQWAELDRLLTELHGRYPDAVVMGHNGFPGHESRGCPCFDWRTYRNGLYELWANQPAEWHGHWIEEVDAVSA